MKPIRQSISENQDFYNGVGVGLTLGVFVAAMLLTRGRVMPVYMKSDGVGIVYE